MLEQVGLEQALGMSWGWGTCWGYTGCSQRSRPLTICHCCVMTAFSPFRFSTGSVIHNCTLSSATAAFVLVWNCAME